MLEALSGTINRKAISWIRNELTEIFADVGQGSEKGGKMRLLCEIGGLALAGLLILFLVIDIAVIRVGKIREKADMTEEDMETTAIPGEDRMQGDVIGQSAERID
ncbi:MAG: hypothetical protein HFH98_06955 [Lachnospiraceae bacterium]|jgi:hypothetical protein|nr:hypothetical protein [Lachnospiraceae bacterium]